MVYFLISEISYKLGISSYETVTGNIEVFDRNEGFLATQVSQEGWIQLSPGAANLVKFQVKAEVSDATLLLSPCEDCDGYEIVIGGWSNTQSVIREGMGQTEYAITQVGC